jgi:hypothetical protein
MGFLWELVRVQNFSDGATIMSVFFRKLSEGLLVEYVCPPQLVQ